MKLILYNMLLAVYNIMVPTFPCILITFNSNDSIFQGKHSIYFAYILL